MRITKSQFKRIVREAMPDSPEFAPTAQEEAERINAQAGPGSYGLSLVTDQEHWERLGITTGEELAMSVLHNTYSDLYKSIHGIRPRGRRFDSVAEVQRAIDDLDDYYEDLVQQGELDAQAEAEYQQKEAELQALMPDEHEAPYEKMHSRSGMGRRTEAKRHHVTLSESKLRTVMRRVLSGMRVDRRF